MIVKNLTVKDLEVGDVFDYAGKLYMILDGNDLQHPEWINTIRLENGRLGHFGDGNAEVKKIEGVYAY